MGSPQSDCFAIEDLIHSLFYSISGSLVRFTHSRRQSFCSLLGGAGERSETEGISIQDNLISRNFFDLITNLSCFFKFPCLDRFIKLDFEILENNFFFSFSCSLEFLYFTSCKRSKILSKLRSVFTVSSSFTLDKAIWGVIQFFLLKFC